VSTITNWSSIMGPTQPRIQWAPKTLSLGVKRPGRESDHSTPSSAELKNAQGELLTLMCDTPKMN